MPATKKPLREAAINDFKINRLPGISNSRYRVYVYIPTSWVNNPTEGLGISANFVNQPDFQNMIFYAGSLYVEKVTKTNILVGFEISDPYLSAVQSAAQMVPVEAELKLSATKTKE